MSTKSSKAAQEAQEALDMLRLILDEKAGEVRIKGRRKAVTLREQILKCLRKLAVNGNASAFAVLNRTLKEYPQAEAALRQARLTQSGDPLFPLVRGGVLTVPKGACIEEVGRMFKRGFTEEEMQALLKLARLDFQEQQDSRGSLV